MARKAKRQTEHKARISEELGRLEELTEASHEVVMLLLSDIRNGKPMVRARALTRWGPACEVYKGVLKDRIRYKLSAKDAPINSVEVVSRSGVTDEEKAQLIAAMEAVAAIDDGAGEDGNE